MCFTLKIYFIGLIAFVASPDQREMHALLVDARQGKTFSDGTPAPVHKPLLVAKAAGCCGQCREQAQPIANVLFHSGRSDPRRNLRRLGRVVQQGGAWELNDSILTIQVDDGGRGLQLYGNPDSAAELEARKTPSFEQAGDFGWVARIGDIVPSAGKVNSEVLEDTPKQGLITARLTLDAGVVKTHTLAAVQGNIMEMSFRTLQQAARTEEDPEPARYYANWVVADIPVAGEHVTIFERNFLTGARRKIQLSPMECGNGQTVEIAVVNLPEEDFGEPSRNLTRSEMHGKHFELFYDLAMNPPDEASRPIPVLARRGVDWLEVYPEGKGDSSFLDAMGLLSGLARRGNAGRPICILAQFSSP